MLALTLIVALAFVAFWPILGSDFALWDDADQLTTNQYLNPPVWDGLAKRWAGPFMHIYIPLTHTVWFLIALVAQSEGLNSQGTHLMPFPFKLASVVLHATASSMVYLLLGKLFRSPWLALFGACLYCVHPLQVEAVGWTSGLKDILFGLFSVACLYFYLGDPRANYRLSGRDHFFAVAMMACACLSKPTALILPAMLVVIDMFITKRKPAEYIPRLMPFAIMAIACAFFAREVQQPVVLDNLHLTLLDRLLIPAHSLAFYTCKFFWPTRLAFDYGVNWEYVLQSPLYRFAWLLPASIALLAIALLRRLPLFGVGLLLAIIPLAPVSGIVMFDFSVYSITADHYVYLPMLGVAIAFVSVFEKLSPKAVALIAIPTLVSLGVLTFRQSLTWVSPLATTMQSLAVNPKSFSSYSILSIITLTSSNGDPAKMDEAEAYARKSISLMETYPRSYNMLANVLYARGRYDEALAEIDQAIKFAPTDAAFHLARAGILGELKRGDESIKAARKVLTLQPDNKMAKQLVDQWDAIEREKRRRGITTTGPSTHPSTRSATAPGAGPG